MSQRSPEATGTGTFKEFSHNLRLYSVAAATTGVSILALASPVQSEVVMTRKNIPLTNLQEGVGLTPIDFNNDGISDVSFGLDSFGPYSYVTLNVFLKVPTGNGAIATKGAPPRNIPFANALVRGNKVGPSAQFNRGNPYASLIYIYENDKSSACSNRRTSGHWAGNNPDRFIGMRFQIKGQTHYGWVRITVATTAERGCADLSATITAWAYETVPNKAITIGASKDSVAEEKGGLPALGMLALGADGVALWRRQEAPGHAQATTQGE
jgi:hypothetical protein